MSGCQNYKPQHLVFRRGDVRKTGFEGYRQLKPMTFKYGCITKKL
jgi:hypothetical protein